MNRKPLLFLGIALAQLAVPAWMITGRERVLTQGEVFKFKTAPIDPRDPFRGEYVRLEFEAESGSWQAPDTTVTNPQGYAAFDEQEAYGVLSVDSSGFALISALSEHPPAGQTFIRVLYNSANEQRIDRVFLPFDRFYLEEGDGAKTEELLQPQWNDGEVTQPLPAYALVRVLNGEAVIEDLIVDERSIHQWLADPSLEPSAAGVSALADSVALPADSASALASPAPAP
ncbi:MAG: GDYXXLXY domain-containing protein [Flavobacteriales bacterium]|jgi:uncharacterized membrane-anchored protein|nr:GDYXXLXY domain-containing protein [Flavobacteriales bacterium]